MKIIENYKQALNEIYNHVGFKEDWVIYPIDDRTDEYWKIKNNEFVIYGEKEDVIEENGCHFEDEIYTQRFYDKWIYRGKELTLIFCDTHIDGMKYFAIFDNAKELNI